MFNDILLPVFWLALGKIIIIDVLLSGDNAVVIAMACRGLPSHKRVLGMVLGAGAAVFLRVAITGTIGFVLNYPYLKFLGGLFLMVVAMNMLKPDEDSDTELKAATSLITAIGTVMIADITMSVDNVVAVAAAANGSESLIAIGLALSIPLIVSGAYVITKILDRFPILIWAGAGLLGWIAGEMMHDDPISKGSWPHDGRVFAFIAAVLVLFCGAMFHWIHSFAPKEKMNEQNN